jgi:dsDNA-specific endonuclease/ATPase MutS2
MNLSKHTTVFVLWLTALVATAQTNVTSTQPVREGQAVSPDKLTVTDATATGNIRPDRVERQKLPPEVIERLNKFRQHARDYLDKQEELKKKLEGANDKERAAIRERMKQAREEWLERAREFRKEFRERQKELVEKLPDYREVLDAARAAAQQSAQQADTGTRPHRGED